MNNAIFSLQSYHFDQVELDFFDITNTKLELEIHPSGILHNNHQNYSLYFEFMAFGTTESNCRKKMVHVKCSACFIFEEDVNKESIPDYFFANCIAIIFPYVRAFVSTVTLQANFPPIVLPTMNLSSLKQDLIEHTIFED